MLPSTSWENYVILLDGIIGVFFHYKYIWMPCKVLVYVYIHIKLFKRLPWTITRAVYASWWYRTENIPSHALSSPEKSESVIVKPFHLSRGKPTGIWPVQDFCCGLKEKSLEISQRVLISCRNYFFLSVLNSLCILEIEGDNK